MNSVSHNAFLKISKSLEDWGLRISYFYQYYLEAIQSQKQVLLALNFRKNKGNGIFKRISALASQMGQIPK